MSSQGQVAEIQARLEAHILSEFAGRAGNGTVDPDQDLLESGVVDSMGVVMLTSFIEEAFGVTVADEDIVPDNFRSVSSMTRYIAERKGVVVEDRFVTDVRSLVVDNVPEDAVVLVASRGDDALLELDGRTGWHFPRADDGAYGHHPADGSEAIGQLETLRSLGATHLVLPHTELWWLDEYAGLREFLEAGSGQLGRTETGVVYSLARGAAA